MEKRTHWRNEYSIILFCIYLLCLTFGILFKGSLSYLKTCIRAYEEGVVLQELTNLHLFSNISTTLYHWKNPWLLMNFLVNIALFLPLGFFLGNQLQNRDRRGMVVAGIAGVAFSLFYELIQHVTGFGSFDVDDIVLNGAGTLAGYGLFVLEQIRDKRNIPVRLKYVLIQAVTNLVYFLCSTSLYYVFHINRDVSKGVGLLLAIGLSSWIWYRRLTFRKAAEWSKKALCLFVFGKCLQIFIMEWLIEKWFPYGQVGLTLAMLLWMAILFMWYSVDKKIKTFL